MEHALLTMHGKGLLVVEPDENFLPAIVSKSRFVPAADIGSLNLPNQQAASVRHAVNDYDSCSQMPVLLIDRQSKSFEFELMQCGMVKIPFIGGVA